jgi:hypothetical protein
MMGLSDIVTFLYRKISPQRRKERKEKPLTRRHKEKALDVQTIKHPEPADRPSQSPSVTLICPGTLPGVHFSEVTGSPASPLGPKETGSKNVG